MITNWPLAMTEGPSIAQQPGDLGLPERPRTNETRCFGMVGTVILAPWMARNVSCG